MHLWADNKIEGVSDLKTKALYDGNYSISTVSPTVNAGT
jgi:hypothetical protein